MSLVDVLEQLESVDEEMEKEASELEKIAAEEDAAGRIMARGFMDELNKLAAGLGKPKLIPLTKTVNKAPPLQHTARTEPGMATLKTQPRGSAITHTPPSRGTTGRVKIKPGR